MDSQGAILDAIMNARPKLIVINRIYQIRVVETDVFLPGDFLAKLSGANLAFVLFHVTVNPHVKGQSRFATKRLAAYTTRVVLHASVDYDVPLQRGLCVKLGVANRTLVVLIGVFNHVMDPQLVPFLEDHPAFVASVNRALLSMHILHVSLLHRPRDELIAANATPMVATRFGFQ